MKIQFSNCHMPIYHSIIQASIPEVDRHDTSAIYRKLTLGDLQREIPQLNWREYLQETLGIDVEMKDDEEVVVYAMPYLIQMGRILFETDRRIVHNYMIWRLVNHRNNFFMYKNLKSCYSGDVDYDAHDR